MPILGGGAHKFEATGEFLEHLEGEERRKAIPPELIVDRMALTNKDSVVDLGSGVGFFALPVSRRSRCVIAIDSEPKMLSILAQRALSLGVGNIHPLLGDVTTIPVADGSADHVLAAFIYHEVSDQSVLVREISRVLRQGGRLTVVDFQKRFSGEGPPIWVKKSPRHVERTTAPWFKKSERFETDVYYQLCFVRN